MMMMMMMKTSIIQYDKQKGFVLRIYQRLFRNQQQLTSISLKEEFSQTADYYYINEKVDSVDENNFKKVNKTFTNLRKNLKRYQSTIHRHDNIINNST